MTINFLLHLFASLSSCIYLTTTYYMHHITIVITGYEPNHRDSFIVSPFSMSFISYPRSMIIDGRLVSSSIIMRLPKLSLLYLDNLHQISCRPNQLQLSTFSVVYLIFLLSSNHQSIHLHPFTHKFHHNF